MKTYYTYIGGAYETKSRFLREASKIGFSRRIPSRNAKSMRFGDQVIFLRWERKRAVAFAEGVINQVIMDSHTAQIAQSLGAEYSPGSLACHRECGSYMIMGSYTMPEDKDIDDIIEAATAYTEEGEAVFCMIGGKITNVYKDPIILDPSPKFTRGFIKGESGESLEYQEEGRVLAIQNYRRK
mgnify:FL=1